MRLGTFKAYTSILLTILLIDLAIPTVRALTEFVDDYENEDYISIKEKITRNPILNAMELNRSMTKKGEEYEKNGYFSTIKLFSGVNGSSLVLLINSTLNKGSIKVQFSNDNSTWIDHNDKTGHDSLREGFESIDLRDLNFDTIYIRYEFKRGKGKMTPRLYQTKIIWTSADMGAVDVPSDDSWVIFLAMGLIFSLSIYFLYTKNR